MASDNSPRATFCDSRETYEAALRSIFSGAPEDTELDLSKIFTPSMTLRDNESTYDFPAFVAHIRWVRKVTNSNIGTLDVVQFLRDGSQLAERHMNAGLDPAGTPVRSETLMFVEVAEDGRIEKVVELVNQLKDGESEES